MAMTALAPFKRLTLWLAFLAASVALVATGAARADDEGGNGRHNVVVAKATQDGSSVFRFRFEITRARGDTVDNQNIARAEASCTDCEATAIAVQIVLVDGKPSTVKPVNAGLSFNVECTRCETFASAHQFVRGYGYPVRLTQNGRNELWAIRQDIRRLDDENLTPADLKVRMDEFSAQIREVVDTELVPVVDDDDDDNDGVKDEKDSDDEVAKVKRNSKSNNATG